MVNMDFAHAYKITIDVAFDLMFTTYVYITMKNQCINDTFNYKEGPLIQGIFFKAVINRSHKRISFET